MRGLKAWKASILRREVSHPAGDAHKRHAFRSATGVDDLLLHSTAASALPPPRSEASAGCGGGGGVSPSTSTIVALNMSSGAATHEDAIG